MALRHGRRDALRMWFGMVAGYLLVATLVMLAAHFADVACGSLMRYLKYAGAAYALFGILVLAGPGANLVWLLCGSRLHHLLMRHRVVTDTVMALALVACAALILSL